MHHTAVKDITAIAPANAKSPTATTATTEPTFRTHTAVQNGGRTVRANARPQPETRIVTQPRYPVRTAAPAPTAAVFASPVSRIRPAASRR